MAIRNAVWDGRKVWEIDNGTLTLRVTVGGGHIASLTHREHPDLNPLWAPAWGGIEPWQYRGAGAERFASRLLASIRGHNLCLGWFGNPSADEQKAGQECHGEASVARWHALSRSTSAGAMSFACGCDLPVAQMRFRRTLTLRRGSDSVQVRERIVSLSRRDIPFTMSEHVTFGPPFLEKGVTVFDAPATKCHTYPIAFEPNARLKTNTAFAWPKGPGVKGGTVDMRMISKKDRVSSDFSTMLMDPRREDAWFSALNPRAGLMMVYHWRREDFPWVGNWEENHGRKVAPWSGVSLTRGMEMANTPFPMALRDAVDLGRFHGLRTYRWLPARGSLDIAYTILLRPIPAGTAGVTDVRRTTSGGLTVTHRSLPQDPRGRRGSRPSVRATSGVGWGD